MKRRWEERQREGRTDSKVGEREGGKSQRSAEAWLKVKYLV